MRPAAHIELLVGSLSLLIAVPAVSASETASPSASPAQTSSAVSTYARTYYAHSAASPSPAASPARSIVTYVPPAAPTVQLVVSVADQKLAVVVNGKVYKEYRISTSRYGEGDNWGSWRTPTGVLQIAGKIGGSAPSGAVFHDRQVTGEVLPANAPGRDPIVSRIIWLRGLEEANRNAYKRCIYIHGTPQEDFLGRKASFGCIRMRSADVIEVFNWVSIGTPVAILEDPLGRAVKEADRETVNLLAQNSALPGRYVPAAKNVPPTTIAAKNVPPTTIAAKNVPPATMTAKMNVAAAAKVTEVAKAAEMAKAPELAKADAPKSPNAPKANDTAKVTDYRIPSPTIQAARVGPPDPVMATGHKNATAAN